MELAVDADTDRVPGCHNVGEGTAEVIQMVAVAVKMNAGKADLDPALAAEELVTLREKNSPRSDALERRTA